MKKIGKMNEIAWVLGVILCALGIALCTKAGLGLSMIAAPVYVIHIKMVSIFPWYSQGVSEYIFQSLLILITCAVCRKFKIKYLLSFVTAFVSGVAIDLWFAVLGGNGVVEVGFFSTLFGRIVLLSLGELFTALAIAFFFRTSLPVQAYELLVAEITEAFSLNRDKVKIVNDFSYLIGAVILALILNHSLQGIGIGTIVITLVNGVIIAVFGKILDRFFTFESAFKR